MPLLALELYLPFFLDFYLLFKKFDLLELLFLFLVINYIFFYYILQVLNLFLYFFLLLFYLFYKNALPQRLNSLSLLIDLALLTCHGLLLQILILNLFLHQQGLKMFYLLHVLPQQNVFGVLVFDWSVLYELGPTRINESTQSFLVVCRVCSDGTDHNCFGVSSQRILKNSGQF